MGSENKAVRRSIILEWVSVIFAGLSIVVSIILYCNGRPAKLCLETYVQEPRNMVDVRGVEDLEVRLLYRGADVDNFWISHIDIKNSGKGTVLGRGARKHLINDTFDLKVSEGSRVLGVDKTDDDIVHISTSSNKVSLSFDQWRQDEVVSFNVFTEVLCAAMFPSFSVCGRPIVEGMCPIRKCAFQEGSSEDKRGNSIARVVAIVMIILSFLMMYIVTYMNRKIRKRLGERLEFSQRNEKELYKKLKRLRYEMEHRARERDSIKE